MRGNPRSRYSSAISVFLQAVARSGLDSVNATGPHRTPRPTRQSAIVTGRSGEDVRFDAPDHLVERLLVFGELDP